jgi:hypothetical protein
MVISPIIMVLIIGPATDGFDVSVMCLLENSRFLQHSDALATRDVFRNYWFRRGKTIEAGETSQRSSSPHLFSR